jgi:hypothetical protein
MVPLVIGDEQVAELKRIKEYAEAHVYTVADMYLRKQGTLQAPGDLNAFKCMIPVGFKVVFSLEQHPQQDGSYVLARHLSVSVARHKRVPSIPAVQMIMDELGFEKPIAECIIDMEEIGKGEMAISVLESIQHAKAND